MDAKTLAISFNAYREAQSDGAKRFWAHVLLDAQRATGVEILPPLSLLYPLTGDSATEERAVRNARLALQLDDMPAPSTPDYDVQAAWRKQTNGHVDPNDGDGGALVPVPSPAPRKPSPSAALSPAQRAAAFFAK